MSWILYSVSTSLAMTSGLWCLTHLKLCLADAIQNSATTFLFFIFMRHISHFKVIIKKLNIIWVIRVKEISSTYIRSIYLTILFGVTLCDGGAHFSWIYPWVDQFEFTVCLQWYVIVIEIYLRYNRPFIVNILYCGNLPWARGVVLGLRSLLLGYLIVCLEAVEGSLIWFISPSSWCLPAQFSLYMHIGGLNPYTFILSLHNTSQSKWYYPLQRGDRLWMSESDVCRRLRSIPAL